MPVQRKLFAIAVASAALYFSEIVIVGALQPGYSHMRQFASELGMADAAHPRVFAVWVLIEAVLFLVAGWYFRQQIAFLTGRPKLAFVIGLFVAFFGVNYIFVATFPLPDPRHSGFGIALFTFFVPWLLAWAFWRNPGARKACYLQLVATPLLIFLVLLEPGVFGFIDESNQGLFQRIGAAGLYGWFVLTGYWRDTSRPEHASIAQASS